MTKIKWDMHRWETVYLLDNLKDYFELTEKQFEEIKKIAKSRIPDKPSGVSEEDYSLWKEEANLYEERYERDFPSKMRYSIIVLLHIIFETRLRATCNEISKRNSIELKENDLKGVPIERAKNFLAKVAHIQIKNHEAWQAMSDNQKIRDCIVHTNGDVSKSRDKSRISEISKKGIGISVDYEHLLDISSEYCKYALESSRKFFDDIFDSAGFGPTYPEWLKCT